MGTLKLKELENVSWSYDEEADVLYISFGKPRPALTMDLGDGILARYEEKTNELVGFTFIGARNIFRKPRKSKAKCL